MLYTIDRKQRKAHCLASQALLAKPEEAPQTLCGIPDQGIASFAFTEAPADLCETCKRLAEQTEKRTCAK